MLWTCLTLYLISVPLVSGEWGEWSDASPCSRSCGVGIQYKDRICTSANNASCEGPHRVYSTCNIQECGPDAVDFRLEQCQSYNNVSFDGTFYEWTPFHGPDPCELTCLATGQTFYYRHAAKVIDGTPCRHNSRDVCIDGTCQPVGCDQQLGSGLILDKCAVCGGTADTCKVHSGSIRTEGLKKGYNDVLLIPQGATSISIRERRPTKSFLALRNLDGVFFMNGRWTVTRPSKMDIAGTTWTYNRSRDHQESLGARGPTQEAIMLSVVHQQRRNTRLDYEFYLPLEVGAINTRHGFHWRASSWSDCDKECGLGLQRRTASCVNTEDEVIVSDDLCDALARPDLTQQCQTADCPAEWYTTNWTECSSSCGEGVQARSVVCRRLLHSDDQIYILTEEADCSGERPLAVRACSHVIPCPQWRTGPWQKCNRVCGDGEQFRDITCVSEANVTLPWASCNPLMRPNRTRSCNVRPCDGVEWLSSQWSGCHGSCEDGYETRHIVCGTKSGVIYPDELCDSSRKPEVRRSCSFDTRCKPRAQWFVSAWQQCSSRCGAGAQSRQVVCAIRRREKMRLLPEERCDPSEKPASEQPCVGTSCSGIWYTAPYRKCTAPCGGGQRRRQVLCFHDNQVTDRLSCNEEDKPSVTSLCNMDTCDEALGCENTIHGCCPDGVTPAEGLNYFRCPQRDGLCDLLEFGCCLDNTTAANGPFLEGCPEFNCTATEFGCCSDGQTPADGPKQEGCAETCERSRYGCCADGVTPAQGVNGESCPEHSSCKGGECETAGSGESADESLTGCRNSLFGCCPDGVTNADGPNLSGCMWVNVSGSDCHSSLYGCCPDGETAAFGPEDEGCDGKVRLDCQNTLFGCCPDGVSVAHGINNEGCRLPDCTSSQYGCCEDGMTEAQGPDHEGCTVPCTSSMYGCCPDDVTAANGPGFMGCPGISHIELSCDATSFGCCGDGATTATGPLFEGCPEQGTYTPTCTDSGYGCCPDGVSSAKGPNFAGCYDVTQKGAICGFTKDRGACSNFTVRWHFDPTLGDCSRFWYGGCGGNGNRFKTRRECRAQCVSPPDLEKCFLPMSTGSCRAGLTKYYHEPMSGTCEQFVYGDCKGNDNRFDSLEECTQECIVPHKADICKQPMLPGPCQGGFQRWYYDKHHDECHEFSYGGCLGNDNRFTSKEACEDRCLQNATTVCSMPADSGQCSGAYTQWFFNTTENECQTFRYGGCYGNANRFHSLEECNLKCEVMTQKEVDVCSLHMDTGTCDGYYRRYYFDKKDNLCKEFVYTGCSGNDNRFASEEACRLKCNATAPRDTCTLPLVVGSCEGRGRSRRIRKYYFDQALGQCSEFMYSGCGGNDNKFDSVLECEKHCAGYIPSETSPTEICSAPAEPGPCLQRLDRYFYDRTQRTCLPFTYGGCKGNRNRFLSVEACLRECSPYFAPNTDWPGSSTSTPSGEQTGDPTGWGTASEYPDRPSATPSVPVVPVDDVCTLPYSPGTCQAYTYMWYYDSRERACRMFMYGGCGGNANRFGSEIECQQRCYPEDVCSLPQSAGACDGYEPSWYYDEIVNECLEFIYSGCGGNLNRFPSFDACRRRCRKAQVSLTGLAVCGLRHERGACQGSYTRWHYDHNLGVCRTFIYGGCNGNENNFLSEEECRASCPISEICGLPLEQGPCTDVKFRYHYDSELGRCTEFVYGGCEGNANRFSNYESCMRVCASPQSQPTVPGPTGSDVCMLAAAPGPCEAQITMYFFDTVSGACKEFNYGGCRGNENRFRTIAECEAVCVRKTTIPPTTTSTNAPTTTTAAPADVCKMRKHPGHCTDFAPVWYFESVTRTCRRFLYSGCGGNENRFSDRGSCQRACLSPPTTSTQAPTTTTEAAVTQATPPVVGPQRCSQPSDNGVHCNDWSLQWYYDSTLAQCRQFYYGGCAGNSNRFASKEMCIFVCIYHGHSDKDREAICTLPISMGSCDDTGFSYETEERWHYNYDNNTCSAFTYLGCNGNANNFQSETDCMSFCFPDWEPQADIGSGEMVHSSSKPAECSLKARRGPCQASVLRWYYDTETNSCKDFIYGGCQGNSNNFPSRYKCELKCKDFIVKEEEVDVCQMAKVMGPCQAQIIRWYYDAELGQCLQFQYGGCQGNMNNFEDYQSCADRCQGELRRDEAVPHDICALEKVKGPCFADFLRFYYDAETKECRPFMYGGCQGNDNNFNSQDACYHSCGQGDNQRLYKPGDCYDVLDRGHCHVGEVRFYYDRSVGDCEAFHYGGCGGNNNNFRSYDDCIALCSRVSEVCGVLQCDLECPYGYARGVDGCLVCGCVDPCENHECPTDQECHVDVQVCITTPCPGARPVCRHKPKPGRCPVVDIQAVGSCEDECNEDIECPNSLKCCSNGCGNVCTKPAFPEEAPVIGDYDTDIIAVAGESVTILCIATGSPPPEISWFKNREQLTTFNSHIEQLSSGSLRIHNVTHEDAGVYSCRAYNGVGTATRTYTIEVDGPLQPTDAGVPVTILDSPSEYTAREGAVLRMECMATGSPSPTIRWLRNNQLVLLDDDRVEQQEDGTLVLNSALVEDTGVYMCEASNGVGQAGLKMVRVKVLGSITVKIVVSNTTFVSGADARLVCEVKGDTEVQFEWMKDGMPLPMDLRYRTTRQGELLLEDVIPTDTGEYTCIVTRKYEAVRGSAYIQVLSAALPADCGDQPFYADCLLIIRARMCRHKYFRDFCCKTCHEHGHLP